MDYETKPEQTDVNELFESLGLGEDPAISRTRIDEQHDQQPDRKKPGVWPFLAGALTVALLGAFGAIVWLLASDGENATTTEAAADQQTTIAAPTTALEQLDDQADEIGQNGETIGQPSAPAPRPGANPAPGSGPVPGQPPPGPPVQAGQATRDRLQQELDRALADNPIVFAVGRTDLDELQTAFVETTVAGLLQAFPGAPVRIVGYADSSGDVDTNRLLSIERARSVEKAILGTGVPQFAMTVEGRGEDESGEFEGSERRVEFEVLPE